MIRTLFMNMADSTSNPKHFLTHAVVCSKVDNLIPVLYVCNRFVLTVVAFTVDFKDRQKQY